MTTEAARHGGHGKCSVCAHPQRAAIDAALTSGALSTGRIAETYGLGHSSVKRHRLAHPVVGDAVVGPEISPPAVETANLDVPAELLAHFQRTLKAVMDARTTGSMNAISGADREHRMTLQDISKWNLEQAKVAALAHHPEVVNISKSVQWQNIRTAMFDVLSKPQYAAARLEIAAAIQELDRMTPEEHERRWTARTSGTNKFQGDANDQHLRTRSRATPEDG